MLVVHSEMPAAMMIAGPWSLLFSTLLVEGVGAMETETHDAYTSHNKRFS